MVQKYIAALLVLTMLGLATPCLAADFANPAPLLQAHLVNPKFIPQRASFGSLAGSLAFAPPQSPQGQALKPSSRSLTTAGKVMKWIGIGLMISGGAEAGYGAIVKDPCSGLSGPYLTCTSNYTTVRTVYFAAGGASVGIGAVLLLVGLRKKE